MSISELSSLLKEKALIIHLLSKGDTTLIIRKGGKDDPSGQLLNKSDTFFLAPSYRHSDPAIFAKEFHRDIEKINLTPDKDTITLSSFARVEKALVIKDKSKLNSIYGWHGYSKEEAERMFNYKEPLVYLYLLRVYNLQKPIIIPKPDNYSGCKSLVSLNKNVAISSYEPAVSDIIYSYRKDILMQLLKG